MRRISESEFSKKKTMAYVTSAVIMLVALITIFAFEFFPSPKYNELKEKEITVSNFQKEHKYRGGYVYRIYTTDGEIYNLTGDFEYDEVKEILLEGTKAQIKYSRNRFFLPFDYAEEVSVNGKIVVVYDNDDDGGSGRTPFVIIGVVFIAVAAANLYFRLLYIRDLQERQAKRDRRIEKKYGKKNNKG